MKNRITSISTVLFLILTAIAVEAQNNPPYVVPVDSEGKPDDTARVQMSEVDGHYEITGIDIGEEGFLFAGIGSTDGSYYSLTSWAVNPPVYALPNPLAISGGQESQIKVEPGTYDISFYTRDSAQSGYHQMIIVPSANPAGPYYPETLYLLSSTGVLSTISGTNGEYILSEPLPTVPFRISYEPQTGVNTYIYGPVSTTSTILTPDTDTAIEYGKGGDAYLTVQLPQDVAADRYELKIDLPQGKVSLMDKLQTSTPLTETSEGTQEYFSIGGTRLAEEPNHGWYLILQNGKASKRLRP